jgi:hypothetical protein
MSYLATTMMTCLTFKGDKKMSDDIPDTKMDIRNMSDQEVQELFETAYSKQVGEPNDIEDPEVECHRQPGSDKMHVLVNICGFAGSPTANQYGTETNSDVTRVVIERADKGRLTFNYNPQMTTALGGIDYQVVYESE